MTSMNRQGLRWNVHCIANVGLRKQLNLYKHGFKIYDLLFFFFRRFLCDKTQTALGRTKDRRGSRNLLCLFAKSCCDILYSTRTVL